MLEACNWTLSKPLLFFLEQGLKMDEVLQLQPYQCCTEAESVFPYPPACAPPAVAQLCSSLAVMEVHCRLVCSWHLLELPSFFSAGASSACASALGAELFTSC